MFYDPMIAKLVTWGPSRIEAIDAMVSALDGFEIDGIGDNLDFLSALMQHPRFRSGEITTGFITEEYPDGFHGAPASEELLEDLAAIAGLVAAANETRAALIDGQLGGPVYPSGDYVVRISGDEFAVAVEPYDGGLLVSVDGEEEVDVVADYVPGQRLLVADIDERRRIVRIAKEARGWRFNYVGCTPSRRSDVTACRRPHAPHDRESRARHVALPARAHAGAADEAGGQGWRCGRGGSADRRDRGDENGEHPPRDQDDDGQGDPGRGGAEPGG